MIPSTTHRFNKPLLGKSLLSFVLGAFAVLGFAPYYIFPAAIISLAGLFYCLQNTGSAKHATWLGYCFGLGLFGAGVSWIYVSLHDFGGMPFLMAALATFAFCAFLALFPAAFAWFNQLLTQRKKNSAPAFPILIATPALWVLFEWIRSWIFTGFPWLTMGYSQVPYSPLAGFAPILGVYGVSLLCALIASLLVLWFTSATTANKTMRPKIALGIFLLLILGQGLKFIPWSTPIGAPISVSLLQGNISQDLKWRPDEVLSTLKTYLDLTRQHPAQLVVLPETALPLLLEQVPPDYINALKEAGKGTVLAGVVEDANGGYFSSVVNIGATPVQSYRKNHLVPFGEFIPFKAAFGWIYRDWLHIPLTDTAAGGTQQRPLALAGQQIALNICYEDAFGEEIIRQLPQATLLVNSTNDAWYGHSLAAYQHMQLSQMRALETGRMMLRATNTGATAIIDAQGYVLAHLPHFTTAALEGWAQGYSGTTPYVRWGNWPVIGLCCLLLGLLLSQAAHFRLAYKDDKS
ncbi:MAG: apolipoprotein N-acyltransferase [Methylophilaceae bacterium]|nr:apolipoprotein N-acyltransferase [Methylophilaceae bacterium]